MSKYETYPIEQYSAIFKALSNPNRLRIFLELSSCCAPGALCANEPEIPRCVGELGGNLDVAPSTVSHHLKELHRAGLVRMQRRGQNVECWVDPAMLKRLARFFDLDHTKQRN